jgi:hypothetical protein
MRIFLASACAEFAAVQARLSRACVNAFNARKAANSARNAAVSDGSLGRAVIVTDARESIAEREVAAALSEVRELEGGFAFILQQAEPANDEKFDQQGGA